MLQDVSFPSSVKIVEVGPRDGLQNIKVRDCFWFLEAKFHGPEFRGSPRTSVLYRRTSSISVEAHI